MTGYVNDVVVAFCDPNPGVEHFRGRVVGSYDRPTHMIETEPGKIATWLQDLCRPATPDEVIEYWKSRALAAEKGEQ